MAVEKLSICCVLLAFCLGFSSGYKPVIIIHGILDGVAQMKDLKSLILEAHPGTPVYIFDDFTYESSLAALWLQVEAVRNFTEPIMKSAKDGVHIIGFSQGGLVARGFIQTTNWHNVDTFVALSSPLNGQYGIPDVMKKWPLFFYTTGDMYKLFYTRFGQHISIANYWKDPFEILRYQNYSDFLAPLNKESTSAGLKFEESWKTNFAKLRKLVMIGGPQDDVIAPWQSAQFGFYNDYFEVVPMRRQKIYMNDVFGLRTLDEKNSLVECTVPQVNHTSWHGNPFVFAKCVEPYLL